MPEPGDLNLNGATNNDAQLDATSLFAQCEFDGPLDQTLQVKRYCAGSLGLAAIDVSYSIFYAGCDLRQ